MTPIPVFTKATKYDARLRMLLTGPPGSGKTFTSLLIASALCPEGKRVALIDTEHGSAVKASDEFDFDSVELGPPFHPDRFTEAIKAADASGLYGALVIDSLSHAWKGIGGLLEEIDRIAARKYKGNTYMAWNDGSKIQGALTDAILSSPMHVIVTSRSKMDYVVERDEKTGKMAPRKVGMAPVQRDDLPYEFDIWGAMDAENTMVIEKSRCRPLAGQVINKPDVQIAETIKTWLSGDPKPVSDIELIQTYMGKIAEGQGVGPAAVKSTCLAELGQDPALSIGSLGEKDELVQEILGWCEGRVSQAAA